MNPYIPEKLPVNLSSLNWQKVAMKVSWDSRRDNRRARSRLQESKVKYFQHTDLAALEGR